MILAAILLLTASIQEAPVATATSEQAADTAPAAVQPVISPEPAAAPLSPCARAAASGEAGTCIPALTPVEIAVRSHLGSKLSKTGETFPLALAAPIAIDGREVLPAGATGMGEIVHAKKSGGSGAGGELVLAARYLDVGGQRLRLRSMKLGGLGKDATGTVNAINVGAAASIPVVAVVGFFITGKGIDIPEGTVANAKTAEEFWVPAAVPAAEPALPAPEAVPAATSSTQEGKPDE